MAILTVGIDLAKNVFALHGVNEAGKAELVRPAVPRDKLHELIAAQPPCLRPNWAASPNAAMSTCAPCSYKARSLR
jgi:hypothetical protein